MEEFLKNNPLTVRHCILYEFLQRKCWEHALEDFTDSVGWVIDEEEFEFWFKRFEKGQFEKEDDKEPITNMSDILRNDKFALRACAFYESRYTTDIEDRPFLEKMNAILFDKARHPVYDKYLRFCKTVGEDMMDYVEFEFWFYRFANNEFDMDYERSEEQKVLLDIPIICLEKIVENMDIVDRILLRKTCRVLRNLTDNQKITGAVINIQVDDDRTETGFSPGVPFNVIYETKEGVCVLTNANDKTKQIEGSHWELAFKDLNEVMKNPKLQMDSLTIGFQMTDNDQSMDALENALRPTTNRQLHIKNIYIDEEKPELSARILPYLKPGVLEEIGMRSHKFEADLINKLIENIVESEQYKQAKKFDYYGRFDRPIQQLFHLETFNVVVPVLTVEDIRQIREILFKSEHFKSCTIRFQSEGTDMDAIKEELGQHLPNDHNEWNYSIPNSREYFNMRFIPYVLWVTKKNNMN